MQLYDYQKKAKADVLKAWADGAQNVGLQSGTGSGKTVVCCDIIADERDPVMVIAHRQEILGQLSLTLGRYGIRHNLLAPSSVIRGIIASHMFELKRSYYDPQARCTVAGVNTVIRRDDPMFARVKLLMQDEAHHVLRDNTWGKAAAMFPNARGLYPTATPCRADGNGLGRHADGILDVLVIGESERNLINQGFLRRYRIVAPPNDLDLSSVTITATGEYSPPKLSKAVHASCITGDIVGHYLKFASGKLGVTFAVDIKAAVEIAERFRSAGVLAEVITGKTPDLLRTQIMRRFQNREIHQLVNVGILGEGVHVKGIEVVSLGAPTYSLAKYRQMVGRVLARSDSPDHAIIIDHAGNYARHGWPDLPRAWTLDRRERRSRGIAEDVIPLRTCTNPKCLSVYERVYSTCPHCGTKYVPTERGTPEHVDGDLVELDPQVLAVLRGEIERVDGPAPTLRHLDQIAQRGAANRHYERQQAQMSLRKSIALWAGFMRDQKQSDSEIHRRFYFMHGIDIASAQVLGTTAAGELQDKIETFLLTKGVVEV